MIKKKTMAALGLAAALVGAGVTVASADAGGSVTQTLAPVSLNAASPGPVAVGTVNSQFSITLTAKSADAEACSYSVGKGGWTPLTWDPSTNSATVTGQGLVGIEYDPAQDPKNTRTCDATVTRTKS